MAVLIDPPRWPAYGRLWSHLASDSSLDELHAFADLTGIPRRAFEGDHYDVPAERYRQAVAAGAQEVEGRELLRRLVAAGLRVPKRRGEHIVDSRQAEDDGFGGAPAVIDLVASPHPAPDDRAVGAWVLVTSAAARATTGSATVLLVHGSEGWDLPGGLRRTGQPVMDTVQETLASAGVAVDGGRLEPAGYLRVRPADASGDGARSPWTYRALLRLRVDSVPEQGQATPSADRTEWRPAEEAVSLLVTTPLGPLVGHLLGSRSTGPAHHGERSQ